MKFLRLWDPLLQVLFDSDEIIAVDKPYGIDTHTNEAKKGNEDFIQPGLIELFEAQLGQKLHIVHRLDQTTTGVIVFAKSLETAKKYQQYFRNRETKKTYVFVTASRSNKTELSTDQPILRNGAELEASTSFRLLKREEGFEYWQANPHTGRNHQIRIHASHLGLPLLGDEKYGGKRFPFLCLHNRKIEFPNGVSIESREPYVFTDLALLTDETLATWFHEVDRRQRLFAGALRLESEQSLRLLHSSRSRDLGLTIDQLGRVLAVSWYKESWAPTDQERLEKLSRFLSKPALVRLMSVKFKEPSGKQREIRIGEGLEDVVRWTSIEGEVKNELRTDVGQSLGLFTDQRLHREWVRRNSEGKEVLNLFSYTGGYSVAAVAGGARDVTSVDTAKSALNWNRVNFELNGFKADTFKFLNRDALQFLSQAISKNLKYDLIICDPPAFSRGEKGLFKIESEIDGLLESCLKCLKAGGTLLFATSFEGFFVDDLRKKILNAQTSAKLKNVEITSLQSALDYELPGEAPSLKSFLIRRLD